MTTLVKVLKMVGIENIGPEDSFSQKKNIEHVGALKPEKHPSARLSRNSPHIGTSKPGRYSSELLSRNDLLTRK